MKVAIITALAVTAAIFAASNIYQSNNSVAKTLMLNPMYSTEVITTFSLWKFQHGKNYSTKTEHNYRLNVFNTNYSKIKANNANSAVKHVSGLNKFSDVTKDEFRKMHGYKPLPTGFKRNYTSVLKNKGLKNLGSDTCAENGPVDLSGNIAGVKDQGQCGSCWAFGAMGALEGDYYEVNGSSISLSEQILLNCAYGYDGTLMGCNGGSHLLALMWSQENGSQTTEYLPYHADHESHCMYNKNISAFTNRSHTDIASDNECEIMAALDAGHVVAIGIAAEAFQSYVSGIYSDWACGDNQLDHAVTLVGYGSDATGQKYWHVKNSWGAVWGESGYFRMDRKGKSEKGICCMTDAAGFAVGYKEV